ncbi:hypothetical protein BGZ95_002309 [Linnemannia exigua]|uniref:Uncharacterized protein n=1 Tax=Linnemannia exigua TaxID=604196 RepID=A0AAD4DIU2_9FUNG|nr:hypothetical protein BGZ95_002309 [Linnemannia exigua]
MSSFSKTLSVLSNRQEESRTQAANQAGSSGGPALKRKIVTDTNTNSTPPLELVPGSDSHSNLVLTSRDTVHRAKRFRASKVTTSKPFTPPAMLRRSKTENPHRGNYSKSGHNSDQQQQQPATANAKDGNKKDGSAVVADTAAGRTAAAGAALGTDPAVVDANAVLIAADGDGIHNKQMLFEKRTRQIRVANDDMHKKEDIGYAPSVLDDNDKQNNWTGEPDGGQSVKHAMSAFAEDSFKIVPAANDGASASALLSSTPRGVSPPAAETGRTNSPGVLDKKHKMDGDSQVSAEDYPQKVARASKASTSIAAASHAKDANLVTEADVIALLKSRPKVTLRNLVDELKKLLEKDVRNRQILSTILNKVTSPQVDVLTLKEGL